MFCFMFQREGVHGYKEGIATVRASMEAGADRGLTTSHPYTGSKEEGQAVGPHPPEMDFLQQDSTPKRPQKQHQKLAIKGSNT